ncbi:hypothetical protein C84B14_17558 [Salinisphaera sp. C84B14]|uniref:T6SS effector BTH_I2691 family protein n=1 Tax=Salinisphaera sp. C84B14 TaxID=1304155 RepID=UPI00333E4959
MSAQKDRCDVCSYKGLVVYPARYAVMPNGVTAPGLGPFSGERVKDIALTESQYALRTMRQGFIYLFYEQGKYGRNYWEVYSVAPDGSLWKQLDANAAQAKSEAPSCSRNGHSGLRTRYLVIENPEQCGTVWLAFSEHKWTEATCQGYEIKANREKRMQPIEPGDWVGSESPGAHTAALSASTLGTLVEYSESVTLDKAGEPNGCTEFNAAAISTSSAGGYSAERLCECMTRYPWPEYIKTVSDRPAEVDRLIQEVNSSAGADNGSTPQATPMIIALWDAVGITHELNGFRNDPVSWFERYSRERALEITAMYDIDQVHAMIEAKKEKARRHADDTQEEFNRGITNPLETRELAQERTTALANANSERQRAQINAYYDDLVWLKDNRMAPEDQQLIIDHAQDTTAVDLSATEDYTGSMRDRLMAYMQNEIPGYQRGLQLRLEELDEEWASFEEFLRPNALADFRENYERLEAETERLQQARTDDIAQWTLAPLWLNTLIDYDGEVQADQIAFENVVNEAIFGLSSTEAGSQHIQLLVDNTDVGSDESIVWRAVAMNNDAARAELTQVLAEAEANKDTPLTESSSGLVTSAVGEAAVLVGLYGGLAGAAERTAENLPKLDKLMMTVGDRIFKKFHLNNIADGVGEKIVQQIFLARAQVGQAERTRLLMTQATYTQINRASILEHARSARSISAIERAAANARGNEALKAAWNKIKDTDEGRGYVRSSRIAVVVAFVEIYNIYHLLSEPIDEEAEASLVASATGLASALIQVMATPAYAVLDGSNLAMRWRLMGGLLGSVGSFVAASSAFAKARDEYKLGQYALLVLYGSSFLANLMIGSSVVISTLSNAGPLIKDIGRQYGAEWILATSGRLFTGAVARWATVRFVASIGGRLVAIGTSWWAIVAITGLQAFISWFRPDPLKLWFARSAFGSHQYAGVLGTDDYPPYSDAQSQQTAFKQATEG